MSGISPVLYILASHGSMGTEFKTHKQSPHLHAQQKQNQAKPFVSVDTEIVTQMSYIFMESVLSVQVR